MKQELLIFTEIARKTDRVKTLLTQLNSYWAVELTDNIVSRIEISSFEPAERFDLFNRLAHVWEDHLISLVPEFYENWPFIVTAYQKLFEILYSIKDFTRIVDNGIRLARGLLKLQFATKEQIAGLLESIGVITYQAQDYQRAIEFLCLAIYYRGSYVRTEAFDRCWGELSQILVKLPPIDRAIMLDCFLENAFNRFFNGLIPAQEMAPKYAEFLATVYRTAINALEPVVRESISLIKKRTTQLRGQVYSQEELQSTLQNLQMMNHDDWAASIALHYGEKMKNANKLQAAMDLIDVFRENSFKHGAYSTVLQILEYQEQLFGVKSTEFHIEMVSLWISSAFKFHTLQNKSYFVKIMQKLDENLPLPEPTNVALFLMAKNDYFRLKQGNMKLNWSDFWWAMLYRTLYEEGMDDIAILALQNLQLVDSTLFKSLLSTQMASIQQKLKQTQEQTHMVQIEGQPPEKVVLTLRIPKKSALKLHIRYIFPSGKHIENLIAIPEFWDQSLLLELLENPDISQKEFNLIHSNPIYFGKLAYLLLPKEIRNVMSDMKSYTQIVPEMSVISDLHETIPFELLHDIKTPLGIRMCFGYRFREPKLTPARYIKSGTPLKESLRVLCIGEMNQLVPQVWNDVKQLSEPRFASPEGPEQTRYLQMKYSHMTHVISEVKALNPNNITLPTLAGELGQGKYHLIHFVSILHFLEDSPIDSYFITPDKQILSIRNILEILNDGAIESASKNRSFVQPLLFFHGDLLDSENHRVKNPFEAFSQIAEYLESRHLRGLICKTPQMYDNVFLEILDIFLDRVTLGDTIGSAMMTANKQQYIKARGLSLSNPDIARTLFTTPIYVYFGEPWTGFNE